MTAAEVKNQMIVGTLERRLETEEARLEKMRKGWRYDAISHQAGLVAGLTIALYVARDGAG